MVPHDAGRFRCARWKVPVERVAASAEYGRPMAARTKKWSDLTQQQRAGVLALVAIQAVLATLAQRDLGSRTSDQLRGPKWLWRLLTLNTVGAVAYLAVGRR